LTANAMQDVNTLLPANSGWVLTEAHGMNAGGTIVGVGTLNGVNAAFVLMPVNAATLVTPGTPVKPLAPIMK
jgi:hypothetical protein